MLKFEDIEDEILNIAILYYERKVNKIMKNVIEDIITIKGMVFEDLNEIKKTTQFIHTNTNPFLDYAKAAIRMKKTIAERGL